MPQVRKPRGPRWRVGTYHRYPDHSPKEEGLMNSNPNPTTKATSPRSASTDAPQQLREMAETGAKQSKETIEKIGAATTEVAEAMTNCCSTALKGMQDYNSKLAEFTQANAKSTVEFVQNLAAVKTPSEFIQVSTDHAKHQLETMTGQVKDLVEITQRITVTTAEPLKAGFVKVFNRAA
jgi:phasin